MNSRRKIIKGHLARGGLASILAVVALAGNAAATPVMDGTFGSNEWDEYLLGTSVTRLSTGDPWMSIDIYAMIEGDTFYAAYLADMDAPGWKQSNGEMIWWGISNLYLGVCYADASRDDTFVGYHEGLYQDFGTGWIAYDGHGDLAEDLRGIGIDAYLSTYETGVLDTNLIEMAIPLSFLIVGEGADRISLWGQYWHSGQSGSFDVEMPSAPVPEPASLASSTLRTSSWPFPLDVFGAYARELVSRNDGWARLARGFERAVVRVAR
jgi:hypothetical protein